mmetsp:Transcript_66898/g.186784  ORF Transcript_66898/g.186784 Transcript_66898/m.186784 type:complete len:278 (-) Transcript_66898:19-852(-)
MPQTRGPLSSSSGEVVEAVRYRRHRSRRHGGHPPLTPLRESSSLAPRDTENRRSWDFDDDQQGSCTGRRPAPVEGSECSFHAPRTPSDAAWQPTPSLTPRSPARPRAEHSAERTPSAQNATLLPAPALPSRPRIVHEAGVELRPRAWLASCRRRLRRLPPSALAFRRRRKSYHRAPRPCRFGRHRSCPHRRGSSPPIRHRSRHAPVQTLATPRTTKTRFAISPAPSIASHCGMCRPKAGTREISCWVGMCGEPCETAQSVCRCTIDSCLGRVSAGSF